MSEALLSKLVPFRIKNELLLKSADNYVQTKNDYLNDVEDVVL